MQSQEIYVLEEACFDKLKELIRTAKRHETADISIREIKREIALLKKNDPKLGDVWGINVTFTIDVLRDYSLKEWKVVARKEIIKTEDGPFVMIEPYDRKTAIPEELRGGDCRCGHCHKNNHKNVLFILHNEKTGEFRQVGRTCCKEYGFDEGFLKAMLKQSEWASKILKMIRELEDKGYKTISQTQRPQSVFNLREYIATCHEIIKEDGKYITPDEEEQANLKLQGIDIYHSTVVKKERVFSTKRKAAWRLKKTDIRPSKESLELADKIIEYFKDFTFDFMGNDTVHWILQQDKILERQTGMVAWLPNKYQSELIRLEREAARKKKLEGYSRGYAGKVGDKLKDVPIEFVEAKSFETKFGVKYLYFFKDNYGHCLLWKTSSEIKPESGDKFMLVSAAIKDTSVYDGLFQTVIIRAKLEKTV